jgi:hypothetical protein
VLHIKEQTVLVKGSALSFYRVGSKQYVRFSDHTLMFNEAGDLLRVHPDPVDPRLPGRFEPATE